MTRAVYVKLWSMTDRYPSRRLSGWRDATSSLWAFLLPPTIFLAWFIWPVMTFEWKKWLTFGLWVDPYRVRRYEGQEGFSARH